MRKIDRQKRQITTRADQEKAINIKQIRKKNGRFEAMKKIKKGHLKHKEKKEFKRERNQNSEGNEL